MEKTPVTEININIAAEETKKSLAKKLCLEKILGNSKAILELREKICLAAMCDASLLITGESGTGKELIARGLHYLSDRSNKPFIPVNCSAIPDNIFENEFFGHVKGAFTDANSTQSGLVQEAEGGSLFLDEIGSISLHAQAKFLRLLQNKEFKPLGASGFRKADIRIIAATNNNIADLIKKGSFREDLYYRLNIISIHIPPLRERPEDIPVLTNHFIKEYSKTYKKHVEALSDETMMSFIAYPWPGNIRELENRIQQLIVLSRTPVIHTTDLLFKENRSEPERVIEHFNVAKKKSVCAFEKAYLVQALEQSHGNVVSAAKTAGKSRTAMWNLLKKHNLSPKQFRK